MGNRFYEKSNGRENHMKNSSNDTNNEIKKSSNKVSTKTKINGSNISNLTIDEIRAVYKLPENEFKTWITSMKPQIERSESLILKMNYFFYNKQVIHIW